jgi:hypothetical protein
VTSNADVKKFLDPTGNGGSNDTDTLHEDTGAIHLFEYDGNGHPAGEKVKEGRSGTPRDKPKEPQQDPF